MRVVITGQPGTRKRLLANKLAEHALKSRLANQLATTQSDVRRHDKVEVRSIPVFEVEDRRWLRKDFLNFLSDYNESEQCNAWGRSLKAINETLARDGADDAFLLIHASFYRNGHFFSTVSWDDLLIFKPDCVITLIDDLYDIWQRIDEGPHDTHLSLDEILTWRSVEISNSRAIALNLRLDATKLGIRRIPKEVQGFFGPSTPHFVMSVKHPLETFYRLVFERPERPVIYASFPITRTRHRPRRREDINHFRSRLNDAGATVIDPLTIDELRLAESDPAWLELRAEPKFQEYQESRWKLEEPAIPPPTTYASPFSGLSESQVRRVVDGIVQHVVDRDFRLVAQCEKLIAYRPFYPEHGEDHCCPK
jgi:hypothetical protein